MDKKYLVCIWGNLCFIWLITFWNSFFAIWKNTAPYIFIPISTAVTVWYISRMIKQKLIYMDLGTSWIYLGLISLIAFYKLLNYQYGLSKWWLWFLFILYGLFLILRIWLYNKKVMSKKEKSHRLYYNTGIGAGVYFVIKMIFNEIKTRQPEEYITIGIFVMLFTTLSFIISSIVGSKFILNLNFSKKQI